MWDINCAHLANTKTRRIYCARILEGLFYENIYLSMVLNKKDNLVYKSHKLFITFHTFYQLLGVGGDLEHLYVTVSFQFHN